MFPNQNGQNPYEVVPPPPPVGHPSGHNPYEFIVNPNTPKRPGFNLFGGNSFLRKILVIVGGGTILIIILAVVASALIPNKNTTPLILTVVERQQEIIRIANLGVTQAVAPITQNFVLTTKASLTTNQTQLLAYLLKHGTKPTTQQLALAQSSQTDKTLANALASNTFDSALQQNLANQLTTYEADIKIVFDKTSDPALKALLQNSYTAAELLKKNSSFQIPVM